MSRSSTAWSSVTHAQWATRSDQEIAHALGVEVAAVRARRRMFGHPNPRPWLKRNRGQASRPGRPPALDWHAIDTEAWATRTNADLARELDVNPRTVAKWRERLGAPPSPAASKGRR